jgi:hypothetical protein
VPSEIEYIFSYVNFQGNNSITRVSKENGAASKNVVGFLVHEKKTLSNILPEFAYWNTATG